jgi:hypothetical protein
MRNTLTFLSGGNLPPDDSSAIDTMASRFTGAHARSHGRQGQQPHLHAMRAAQPSHIHINTLLMRRCGPHAAAVPRLSETRLIDRGQVAKDSQFLFSIGSKGQLAIEGESRQAATATGSVAAPCWLCCSLEQTARATVVRVQLGLCGAN